MRKTRTAWMVAAVLLPLLACGGGGADQASDTFSARLDATDVIPIPPPNVASFSGAAGFTFDGQVIAFSADLQGLFLAQRGDRYLRLRVHSGRRGTNGPPLATISVSESEIAGGNRFLWQGRLGADALDTARSVEEVVTAMREGEAYVQVTHWQIMNLVDAPVAIARGQIASGP